MEVICIVLLVLFIISIFFVAFTVIGIGTGTGRLRQTTTPTTPTSSLCQSTQSMPQHPPSSFPPHRASNPQSLTTARRGVGGVGTAMTAGPAVTIVIIVRPLVISEPSLVVLVVVSVSQIA